MAEAVRPAKKKKKGKKTQANPSDSLTVLQRKTLDEEEECAKPFLEEGCAASQAEDDGYTPQEESGQVPETIDEQVVAVTSGGIECNNEGSKATGETGSVLGEMSSRPEDNSAQTEVELPGENVADPQEITPGNTTQSDEVVSKQRQSVETEAHINDKKECSENNEVVGKTGDSVQGDMHCEFHGDEGQVGNVEYEQGTGRFASVGGTMESMTNMNTELTEENSGGTESVSNTGNETEEYKISSESSVLGCEENVCIEGEHDRYTDEPKGNHAVFQENGGSSTKNNVLEEVRDTEMHHSTVEGENAEVSEMRIDAQQILSGAIHQESNCSRKISHSEQSLRTSEILQANQEKNVYGHIYNLFGKQQVSGRTREAMTAFSEDDLKSFYYNPALIHIEGYVDDFIKETQETPRENEFFELLHTYGNTSKNLRNVESDIEILRKKCREQKRTVWSTEMKTVTGQGFCADHQKVSYTHSYEAASFNLEQATKVERTLDCLKNTIHETFTLAKYSCQLARIHITSYIYELHAQSPVFCGISEESPVIGTDPSHVSQVVLGEIQHLRDCISALFIFMRRPTEDEEFYNDVNSWLQTLVALLLRVATLPDHFFLLNHVLRCPPGVTRKLTHFIQPLLSLRRPGDFTSDEYFWHNPLLHHFVTMLATLLLPIKFREKYLIKMKAVLTPDGSESQKNISWVIVDEDGEEDENPEESWMLIPENDLIAVFLQFPFDGLFKQIFEVEEYEGVDVVDFEARGMNRKTGENVMQVFAFSTCLIEILGKAFSHYKKTRYREFVKRLGRAIRTIVMHVSHYWSLYKNHYLNKYGDNETTFHFAFGTEYSLEKLQLEYDQFFIRASQQIFFAHKLGVWQFLTDMPFQSLSSKMTWSCYRFLHKGIMDKDSSISLSDYISLHCEYHDTNDSAALVECFKSMHEAEVVFLLTIFANMARSRTLEDNDFITTVVREIYEVSYIAPGTLDFLPKTGKDLLSSICSSHPFVMSLLLDSIEETLEKVREECVSLFHALPVEMWRPKSRDIQTVRNWLLRSPIDSPEHQLSRYLLTNLNWQYQDADSDILYLPRCVHRAVAVLLVEVCALRLSNRPGGIAVDVFKETPGILEQVTQIATVPYQRYVQHYSDQDLYKWLWEVMMFLHLHETECPTSVMNFTDNPQSAGKEKGITSSYDRSDFFKTFSKSEPLDLDTDEVLVNVLTSTNKDGPLACYAALQLSNHGHDPEHLGTSGLSYLSVVLEEGHTFAACRIIANVIPKFFARDLLGFAENTRFSGIIDTIIHSDARWRDEDVLEIMSGIIQKHIQKSGVLPGTNRTLMAIKFWFRTLCSLPCWNSDIKVIHLLNNLLEYVFRVSEAQEIVIEYFVKKHQETLKSLKEQGFLSSLFSFVISSASHGNIVDIKTLSSYSYFCYYILWSESLCQEESALRFALANKLHDKPEMCVETALKKVLSSMKNVDPIPSSSLDIYRWAELALSVDHDHPILAAVWQNFFYQFLRRVPAGAGVPERGSVGLRFFESTVNTTYLKKMKARLMGTAEHHKTHSVSRNESNEDNAIYKTPPELHRRLAKLFQTLALWLDEPRVHDPTLYLQGLPPVYDSQRLTDILKSNKNVWFDCVDTGKIDWELNASVQCFLRFSNERQKKISLIQNRQRLKKNDRKSKRIIDDSVPPPCFQALSTPLPEFPMSVLLDKQKIMETLGDYLRILGEHARKFTMKFSSNSALDLEYVDMLQHLYCNPEATIRVGVPCQRRKVCRGAADIVVRFHEKKTNDSAMQGAIKNREEYEGLIHEMLHEMPPDICVNALCVEKSLTLLLKQWKSCQNPALVKKFESIGSCIFFIFVEMVSDGVRRFPPTMQFFSTCIELLGKVFIMENKEQTEVLLRTILAHPNIVGLLLPIFQPSTCEDDFTEMYENVIQTSLDVEVKFSLLSKFDFKTWLASKPTLSERITMMNVLFAALCDCGLEPPVKITMLSELYMRKMVTVLLYQFPDLFGETLRLLVVGSADHALCISCWNEFLIATKILNKNMERRELELNISPPFLLEERQVSETMAWLVSYYNDQRSAYSSNTTEGLFTMWKPYLTSLTALYEYISRQSLASREQQLADNDAQVTTFLWKRICDFFSPWIFPSEFNGGLNFPWSETEVVQASEFVELYARVLIYFQNFLPESSNGKPNVLSLLWELYSSFISNDATPRFVIRVYHAKFTYLPWNAFHPTVSYLKSMLQICTQNENCRSFLGCIFPRIPWTGVMQRLRALEDVESLRQIQTSFFNLLLMLGNERAVIKVEGSEMSSLLKSAESFQWDLLEANMYSSACNWFVSNCNFVEILEPSSTIWSSLRLLKAAALLSDPIPTNHTYNEIQEKRQHYLNCVVKLLCKCSSGPQHSPGLFRPVIEQLMNDLLVPGNAGETINIQSITVQYMEVLNILNRLSPREKVLDLALETLQEKIRDLTEKTMILAVVIAACRSLASVSLMVQIVEVAMETHFSNIKPIVTSGSEHRQITLSSWSDVLSTLTVPELSQREFIQECVNHNAVLTLFAHVVQCLSVCQSTAQEFNMLKDLTAWAASIKPCNPDTETKVILLWYKILELITRQVDYGVNLRELGQQVDFLIPLIAHAGEDRDTSGLLGVIGFGRKSSLTVNFRFLCRALSTFLSAQLPSNSIPRVKPDSPGAVKENSKKEFSAGVVVHVTQRASTAFHNLESLRMNKTYSGLMEHIEFSCRFIANPSHSLRDGPEFLKKLTKDLFKGKSYLDVVN